MEKSVDGFPFSSQPEGPNSVLSAHENASPSLKIKLKIRSDRYSIVHNTMMKDSCGRRKRFEDKNCLLRVH
jgi:hypothetical protein